MGATSASSGQGVYIGRDLYGGSFAYDPFSLYEQRALTNPNMLVIGEVGSAKSSLVKCYLHRQALFGRVPWISDPKGEYGPLAECARRRADPASAGRRRSASTRSARARTGRRSSPCSRRSSRARSTARSSPRSAVRCARRSATLNAQIPHADAAARWSICLLRPTREMAERSPPRPRALAMAAARRRARHSSGSARASCAGCSTARRRGPRSRGPRRRARPLGLLRLRRRSRS